MTDTACSQAIQINIWHSNQWKQLLIILTYIFLILMQKFLDFKAKIVRSKRESQRVEQEDIFYLIRRHQNIKTIKKNKRETQNIRNRVKFSSLPKTFKEREKNQAIQEASDDNQIEIGLAFEKQQSTLQSVNTSSPEKSPSKIFSSPLQNNQKQWQSNHPSHTQQTIPLFQIIQSKLILPTYTETNFKSEYPNKNSQNAIIPHKNRIYQDLDEKANPSKKCSLEDYLTTREMLQLDSFNGAELMQDTPLFKQSRIRKIQSKLTELYSHEYQKKINRFDEDKIQMLFREEYKEFFLSSLSTIPNREDESLNTLKSQFQFSNQFQQSSQEKQKHTTSKFDKIWGFFNQKQNNKFLTNNFQSECRRPTRQKIINLQQKQVLSKIPKNQSSKQPKNDKKQNKKPKRGAQSVKK